MLKYCDFMDCDGSSEGEYDAGPLRSLAIRGGHGCLEKRHQGTGSH